ncbi:MAG: flagellar hook-basal body protein [Oscillospiraceae bacterium]|jgi:flagellar basal-body rod protein FlgG|nr:flagellar hook-basal body protein [Oscillospiraceae bacterium]
MYEGLNIAQTGLMSMQMRLDVIADNIANVNTNGFKASRLEFKDALYTAGLLPALAATPEGNQQEGHGTLPSAVSRDFSQGALVTSGNPWDFAIEGEGFFALQNTAGDTVYTRTGSFYKSIEADGAYLVNDDGYYVLDNNGERILTPEDTIGVAVDSDGTLSFETLGGNAESVTLGVYTFRNTGGILALGDGNFGVDIAAGERLEAVNFKVLQGMTEASNVDLATEMTLLVRSQRVFSLAARAVTTADDMEGVANNMKS